MKEINCIDGFYIEYLMRPSRAHKEVKSEEHDSGVTKKQCVFI